MILCNPWVNRKSFQEQLQIILDTGTDAKIPPGYSRKLPTFPNNSLRGPCPRSGKQNVSGVVLAQHPFSLRRIFPTGKPSGNGCRLPMPKAILQHHSTLAELPVINTSCQFSEHLLKRASAHRRLLTAAVNFNHFLPLFSSKWSRLYPYRREHLLARF